MSPQPNLFERAPLFDGPDLQAEDHARLGNQLAHVREFLRAGHWWSLREMADELHYPEASISARLRDLRKQKHGGYTIERRHLGRGLFQYRLAVDSHARQA